MIAVQLIATAAALGMSITDEPRGAPAVASASASIAASQSVAERAPTRYCVIDTITGSRIKRKTCQTRAEWMREGFDPIASK